MIAVLGLSWVMLAAGYFVGWLDKLAATSGAAATTAVALLFGVVIPWPVEYLPWNRR